MGDRRLGQIHAHLARGLAEIERVGRRRQHDLRAVLLDLAQSRVAVEPAARDDGGAEPAHAHVRRPECGEDSPVEREVERMARAEAGRPVEVDPRLAPQLGRVIRERNVERRAGRARRREALMEELLGDRERVTERRADRLRVEDLLLVDERQPLDEVVHRADLRGGDLVAVEELSVHRASRVRVLDRRLKLAQVEPIEIGARHRLRVGVPELLSLDLGLVEFHESSARTICVPATSAWSFAKARWRGSRARPQSGLIHSRVAGTLSSIRRILRATRSALST